MHIIYAIRYTQLYEIQPLKWYDIIERFLQLPRDELFSFKEILHRLEHCHYFYPILLVVQPFSDTSVPALFPIIDGRRIHPSTFLAVILFFSFFFLLFFVSSSFLFHLLTYILYVLVNLGFLFPFHFIHSLLLLFFFFFFVSIVVFTEYDEGHNQTQ